MMPADKIQQLMQRNFQFCRAVLEFIGARLRTAEKQLENLIIKDARTRIVEFLHSHATKTGRPVGLETLVKHPFTHQDMAAITGTSRQMVTAVMNDPSGRVRQRSVPDATNAHRCNRVARTGLNTAAAVDRIP